MTWQEQLAALRPLIGHIKDYEAKIIIDMHKRMISYGDECRMSEKQVALVDRWYGEYVKVEPEQDTSGEGYDHPVYNTQWEAEQASPEPEVEPEPDYGPAPPGFNDPPPEPDPEVTEPPEEYQPPAGW